MRVVRRSVTRLLVWKEWWLCHYSSGMTDPCRTIHLRWRHDFGPEPSQPVLSPATATADSSRTSTFSYGLHIIELNIQIYALIYKYSLKISSCSRVIIAASFFSCPRCSRDRSVVSTRMFWNLAGRVSSTRVDSF